MPKKRTVQKKEKTIANKSKKRTKVKVIELKKTPGSQPVGTVEASHLVKIVRSGRAHALFTNVVLGYITDKPESQMTAVEKMAIARDGITKNALEQLKTKADLDYDQLAQILSVARATLINKKGDDKFNHTLSEKIVGLADVYSYGYDVFEDENKFNRWMFHPNRALNGQAPFDLMDNQFGREEVRDLIGRIEYGVFS